MKKGDLVIYNKDMNIKTYVAIILNSNLGSKIPNPKERFICNNTIDKKIWIKYTNRIVITDCIDALLKGSLINIIYAKFYY